MMVIERSCTFSQQGLPSSATMDQRKIVANQKTYVGGSWQSARSHGALDRGSDDLMGEWDDPCCLCDISTRPPVPDDVLENRRAALSGKRLIRYDFECNYIVER